MLACVGSRSTAPELPAQFTCAFHPLLSPVLGDAFLCLGLSRRLCGTGQRKVLVVTSSNTYFLCYLHFLVVSEPFDESHSSTLEPTSPKMYIPTQRFLHENEEPRRPSTSLADSFDYQFEPGPYYLGARSTVKPTDEQQSFNVPSAFVGVSVGALVFVLLVIA